MFTRFIQCTNQLWSLISKNMTNKYIIEKMLWVLNERDPYLVTMICKICSTTPSLQASCLAR